LKLFSLKMPRLYKCSLYICPEQIDRLMIKVNSLSGGRTSSYMAVHYPADREVFSVVCIDDPMSAPKDAAVREYASGKLSKFTAEFGEFIATAEDDATLRVMMDLEQIIGREIEWVRGSSFDDVISVGTKTRLPSWARRYCTTQMKLLPIFLWWMREIGVKCDMRIGFRFDEFQRMQNFFNNSDPTNFSIPVSCSLTGERRMKHEAFKWRYCSFPMVKDAITEKQVTDYWSGRGGVISGDLFTSERRISFPSISNCIGCFHKKPETLAAMSDIHPDKFRWFINQEQKGMGTWLDSKVTYQHIMDERDSIGMERIFEARKGLLTCDSGGCTD